MERELLFADKLQNLRETAKAQGNLLTEAQVKEAFADFALDEEQLALVYDYLKKHTTITFDTMYRPGTYKIFASFQSKAYDPDSEEFKYYDFINAETSYDFEEYLNNIKNLSLYYDEENAPSFGDEIITLSTCDYYTTDGRFAVLAKRIK